MRVNTLSVALAGLLASAAPVFASTLSAEITGHNVSSRFLSGGFIPLPSEQTWETVSNLVPSPVLPPAVENTPIVLSPNELSFTNAAFQPTTELQSPSSTRDTGTSDPIFGGEGSGSGRGVGTVPLPAALPMFGLALLSLCGLGLVARRQKARTRA